MADEITPVEEIQNKSTEEEQQHRLSANVEPTHDSSTSDIDHLVVMVHGMDGRYVLIAHILFYIDVTFFLSFK
jgi:hypothetical protein